MIVIIGLIILIAAVVVAVAGVLANGDSAHALTHGFAVFGYHVTGSAGTLFLYGIVVGAIAVLGLSLLLVGARRTSRRGAVARQRLSQARSQTTALRKERDDLIDEHESTRREPGRWRLLLLGPHLGPRPPSVSAGIVAPEASSNARANDSSLRK